MKLFLNDLKLWSILRIFTKINQLQYWIPWLVNVQKNDLKSLSLYIFNRLLFKMSVYTKPMGDQQA